MDPGRDPRGGKFLSLGLIVTRVVGCLSITYVYTSFTSSRELDVVKGLDTVRKTQSLTEIWGGERPNFKVKSKIHKH